MTRYCLIGPTYPFRGGISHYTTLLAMNLKRDHEVLLISFTRQYPSWLFPGQSDQDPSANPLQTESERLIDPLSPVSWRRAVKRIEAWSADVVVVPWWVPFWAPAWAYIGRGIRLLAQRPKLIFICHNVLPHEKSLIDKVAASSALRRGDGFIVHSQNDRIVLQKLLVGAAVEVSPHPTYRRLVQSGSPGIKIENAGNRPIILFCGFVRPYKGLDILLDAMPAVLARWNIHLVIAGEFWKNETSYRRQINELGIQDAVTIINRYLADDELASVVAQSSVVVLPYRSATQSGIIQVAFGLGRPVITTSVGGLAETVEDGRTGLIVPPEDPQALARAIVRFFDDQLEATFENNILADSDRFDWQRLIEKIELLAATS